MVKKLKELSNLDIDKMCAHIPGYGGCMSKDELPKKLPESFCVINMEDSDKGHGTHWCLLDNRSHTYCSWVDSEGEVPPRRVKSAMNATGKKQKINKFMVQPLASSSCGWYCVAAAKAMTNDEDGMENFLSHFDLNDPSKNDKILAKMF